MIHVLTRGTFGLITRNKATLVGDTPHQNGTSLIQIPGGKKNPNDDDDPIAIFYRELPEEVAFQGPLRLELVFSEPLVQFFDPTTRMILTSPSIAREMDIRYTYRFEAIGSGRPVFAGDEGFLAPRFVPQTDLEKLEAGTEIRHSTKGAIKAYAGKGSWPRLPAKLKEAPFGTLEDQFRIQGFSDAFIEAEVGPIRAAQSAQPRLRLVRA